ncbi:metallopeptidase [Haematococcus lacustris]
MFVLGVRFQGAAYTVSLEEADPSLETLGKGLAQATGAAYETLKILGVKNQKAIVPSLLPDVLASSLGLRSGGSGLMLLGSKAAEVQAVQAAQEPARTPGFEHEAQVAARRRQRSAQAVGPPARLHNTFGEYQVLQSPGLQPPPSAALQLLHSLAADPGISTIMEKHGLSVGKLSEMPPEGSVGVDPVCLLGLNRNAGQEILLRLRTDDLRGFRKFQTLRETLIHELTHNTHGPHDDSFKERCSLLTRECLEVDARLRQPGRLAVLNPDTDTALGPRHQDEDEAAEPTRSAHPAMAATASSSGQSLRQLAMRDSRTQKDPGGAGGRSAAA